MTMRRWAINGRFLAQPLTGVQRYAYEIVRALDDVLHHGHPHAPDLEIKLVVPGGIPNLPKLRCIEIVEAGTGGGRLWEQRDLPRVASHGLISLCNSGPLRHKRQIVCIHDLNTRIVPESYSAAFRALYRVFVPALAHRAARVTTVSQFSARQLEAFGICDRSKIRVIPNGSEHTRRWAPAHSERTRDVAGKRTILTLGSRAPHKNLKLLLGIAPDLERMGFRLAIAGASDPNVFSKDRVFAESRSSNLVWLGRVSDEELAAIMEDCLCLAFPSLTEGFGLPPLEAMARGCPVVVSDRASLPEVCGTAALYAAPDDPSAWVRQFERLSLEPELRSNLVFRGLAEAKRYSWKTSAELYLDSMAECDGIEIVGARRAIADEHQEGNREKVIRVS